MPTELTISSSVTEGCANLSVTDTSVITAPSIRAEVESRNLSVLNPCGVELVAGGAPQVTCIELDQDVQVTQTYDFSAYPDGTSTIIVNSVIGPVGINLIATPISVAPDGGLLLAGQVATLAPLLQAAFLAAGYSIAVSPSGVALTMTTTVRSILGNLSGTTQIGAGALTPRTVAPATQAPYNIGQVFEIAICDFRFSYTLVQQDVVVPSPSIPASQAISLTSKNILGRLWSAILPSLDDILCKCRASFSYSDCDTCGIQITSAVAGVPLPTITLSTSIGAIQLFTQSDKIKNVSNWNLKRSFVYDFGASTVPKIDWTISLFSVDGENKALIPFAATNSISYTDQIREFAGYLSSLGDTKFSVVGTTVVGVSTQVLGVISGTDNAVAFSASPVITDSTAPDDNVKDIAICGDGVYLATLTYGVKSTGFASATIVLPATSFTTLNFKITGTAPFPVMPIIALPYAGTTESMVDFAVAYLNVYFASGLGLTQGQITASKLAANTIKISISLGYLTSLNPAWTTCLLLPNAISLAPDTTLTGGTLDPSSVLQFNLSPCVFSSVSVQSKQFAIGVDCNSQCKLSETVIAEANSGQPGSQWLPVSSQISALLSQFALFLKESDYVNATKMIRKIETLTRQSSCGPCAGGAQVWASGYAIPAPQPCNC